MEEDVRQKLVDDHFLFVSGDKNLIAAGMERDWPEGRGIFHNAEKTFLVWVNEEDQLRIISMQEGGDVKGVFERLARGINAVQVIMSARLKKEFSARRHMKAYFWVEILKITAKLLTLNFMLACPSLEIF